MTDGEAIGLIIAGVILLCVAFGLGMRYQEIVFLEDIAEVKMQRSLKDDY